MDYYSRPELSQSQLKDFLVSPAYYQLRKSNPIAPTDAMELGTAIHCAVLEPSEFNKRYGIAPVFDRRTKAGKEEYAAFQAMNEGKIFLDPETHNKVIAMRDSVMSHPRVKDVFSFDIKAEEEIFFSMDGIECKAKLDAIVPTIGTVVDFKTARSASSDSFRRDMINMRYDLQAFWYCEAYRSVYNKYPDFYAFIVASKEEPYPVGFFSVDNEFLDRGRFYALSALKKFKECQENNIWPKNESDEVIRISTPEWAMREAMEFGEAYFTTMNREF